MTRASDTGPLLDAITGALDLIRTQGAPLSPATLPAAAPLASLLDQCRAWHQQSLTDRAEPIRTIHHLACSGGTLISKCLAVMPNTRLLSELAPLTTIGVDPKKPRFVPSDLVLHLKNGLRPVDTESLIAVFLAGLETLADQSRRRGERLILRDHAHSQFCVGPVVHDYPPLHRMVARLGPVLSVVTVRHPLDSYLSLVTNAWEHHRPVGLEEYARRYLAFLDAHADLPVFRYEDFVAAPDTVLADICAVLELPCNPAATEVFSVVHISGDSGRSAAQIGSRPRRTVPDSLAQVAAESDAYQQLCARMGY